MHARPALASTMIYDDAEHLKHQCNQMLRIPACTFDSVRTYVCMVPQIDNQALYACAVRVKSGVLQDSLVAQAQGSVIQY